jgi:hypothetical protein
MSVTRAEIVARCLPILEAAKNGKPAEDTFVELKSALPKDEKAARGIAGSANAAGGEPVIWLVGIDEKTRQVVGASKEELSAWYPRLKRYFDGPAPTLSLVENIPVDNNVVVAMVFGTDEGPYVVNLGPDTRDTPWREGNRTRSAYRQELLRTLAGPSLLPTVDLTSAAFRSERDDTGQVHRFIFYAHLYVKPRTDRTLVFPRHDCAAHIEIDGCLPRTPFDTIWLFAADDKNSVVPDDVKVDRPRALCLMAFIGPVFDPKGQQAEVTMSLLPVNAGHPIVVRHEIALEPDPVPSVKARPAERVQDPWAATPLRDFGQNVW